MANAENHITRVIKEEAGYQVLKNDTGNYYNGALIGTKYGITPGAYFNYYKKVPTVDTIKNLTVPQAVPIYKKDYWDKIKGDKIKNDSVAALMMFTVVNSGPGMVKSLKALVNAIAGKKLVPETFIPFTDSDVAVLNSLPQDRYFNALKAARKKFYENRAKKPGQDKFLKGWLNRLNTHKYSGAMSPGGNKTALKVGGLLLGLGLAGFLWHKYS